MRFARSQEPAKQRQSRTPKMPDSVKAALLKDPGQKMHYFDLWVGHSEDWAKVVAFERRLKRDSQQKNMRWAWLTEEQLVDVMKSETVAHKIMERKTEPDFKKKHPDADVWMYYCMVADEQNQMEESLREKGVSLTANIDQESATELLPKLIQATEIPSCASVSEPSPVPTKSEEEMLAERAKKKEIAAQKKADRQRALEHNFKLRIEAWLKGISKEVQKAKEAGVQTGKIPDEDLKNLYGAKFAKHQQLLSDERVKFENAHADEQQHLKMADVEAAEAAVTQFKKDHAAFQKLKTCYELE